MTPPGRPASMSITDCLERLEALLRAGPPRFPPGRRAAWDEETRALLQRLREALGTDAKRAATVGGEAEAILRRAQGEGRRIGLEADDHARRAIEGGPIAPAAGQQDQQMR